MTLRVALVTSSLASSLLLPGCIDYLPPSATEPISGKRITGHDADFIVPGKTTRAEVIRNLGGGYSESPLVTALAYPWESSAGNVFWVIVGGNARGRR